MKDYEPIIYILSGLGTDPIIRALNELGIAFYSMKPVSMSVIIQNLKILINQQNPHAFFIEDNRKNAGGIKQEILEDETKDILLQLGIMPHRISSKCVMDALVMYMCSSDPIPVLTKVLYPQIAEKYGINNSSVEKNIRDAISLIQRNKTDMYNAIFSYSTKENITNGEFLSVMSAYISKNV